MSRLNHYAISAILGSEVIGPVKMGHGQIASMVGGQKYFDGLAPMTHRMRMKAEVVASKVISSSRRS